MPADEFHPDRGTPAEPAYGGRVVVHLTTMPKNVCHPIENTSTVRTMLDELHESLVRRDPETWEFEPAVAEAYDVELANDNDGDGAMSITFELREGVLWHDGHAFDVEDVLFSWGIYRNEHVDCDANRAAYLKATAAEALDEATVRFIFDEPYFDALGIVGEMTLLPRHLYDLTDPEHPRHDPDADAKARAKEINENPRNIDWVGLGPYRMTAWTAQYVDAERFPDYFDPENGGYVDRIRWRYLSGTEQALQALINGELDFTTRLSSADYFGEFTAAPEFTERFFKGYVYLPSFNYNPWNTRRALFADARVRRALALAFDLRGYRDTVAHGLARLPTGPQPFGSPGYDMDLEALPFDPEGARELLAEAGWYDRDGDGVIDRDGVPFELEFLAVAGNVASELFSQKMQESYAGIGVRVTITSLEWASLQERVLNRDFDTTGLARSLDVENDPEQMWHSKGAPVGVRGSNLAGLADPEVDALIARGQVELDGRKRAAIWRELHGRLFELQPVLFRLAPPIKFAMTRELRGFQAFGVRPGYAIRRWYYPAGTPGTRPER